MLVAEAEVPTERPGRYLVQLCRHVSQVARASQHMRARVESYEHRGVIDVGWARCTLWAAPGVLRLRAEAADEPGLRELQQRIAARLEQIGRRDHLTITWTRPGADGHTTAAGDNDMTDPWREPENTGMPRWLKVAGIVLALLALLVVVAMLLSGGEHGPRRHGSIDGRVVASGAEAGGR